MALRSYHGESNTVNLRNLSEVIANIRAIHHRGRRARRTAGAEDDQLGRPYNRSLAKAVEGW
jgi:hypothetical protein